MDRKTLWVGMGIFFVVGLVAVAVLYFSQPATFRGTSYGEPYPVAPEFDLTQSGGTPYRLSDSRGKVVALFFGYTSCPDVCPTTMAELKQALGKLGDRASQVQVLFVTVDPERDTPERVQEYVNHFDPSFVGLSGTVPELAEVWNEYGVFREVAEGSSAAGYLVTHTARVTLIDQEGNLRVSLPFDAPVEDVVHDLNLLLKQ